MGFFDRFVRAVSSVVETVTSTIGDALGLRDEPAAPADVEDAPDVPDAPSDLGGDLGVGDDLGDFGESLSDVLGPPDETELGDRSPEEIEAQQWAAWLEHNQASFSHEAYAELIQLLAEGELDDLYWSVIDYESDSDT